MGFESNQYQIRETPDKETEPRVVKVDAPTEPKVADFEFQRLNRGGQDYSETKRKYGSLAATDSDRTTRNQRDRRFSLNPLLRDPLSVEEEEKRVIEEKVRARISAMADEALASAAAEGYREGLKRGHEEAFKKFRDESQERVAAIEKFVANAEAAKEEIFRANERFLIELIFRIARMVILKDLSQDREYLVRLAKEMIDRLGVRENISIRINPDDMASLAMLKEGLEKGLSGLRNVTVEVSEKVQRGGCVVETQWNAIDASIETQLQGVYNALIGESGAKP